MMIPGFLSPFQKKTLSENQSFLNNGVMIFEYFNLALEM